jgi:hypothetical protein
MYNATPFKFYDRLEEGEGEQFYDRGYAAERAFVKWAGGMGGTVRHLSAEGLYNAGYDVTISSTTTGKEWRFEVKSNLGADKHGNPYETFFCETLHGGGDQPGWMKAGSGCSHFVILNESTGYLHFFDRHDLKAHVSGNAARKSFKNNCEGRLVGWDSVEAGFKLKLKMENA